MFTEQYIFTLLFLYLTLTQTECSNVNVHPEKNTGWNGFPTGRRLKRNPKEEIGSGTLYFNPNKDELNTLAELIQENPWSMFSAPEGQKRQMNFTPRLGRDAGEDNVQFNTDRLLPESEVAISSGDMSVRSPQFSPRLGRRIGNSFGYQFGRYT